MFLKLRTQENFIKFYKLLVKLFKYDFLVNFIFLKENGEEVEDEKAKEIISEINSILEKHNVKIKGVFSVVDKK